MNILFKTSLAAVLALAAAQSAEAGSKIYTCEINGEIVYTSRASGNCHSADLPSIGRYSSSRYDSPMPSETRTQPEPQYRPVQKRSAAKAGMPKPQPVQQAPLSPRRNRPATVPAAPFWSRSWPTNAERFPTLRNPSRRRAARKVAASTSSRSVRCKVPSSTASKTSKPCSASWAGCSAGRGDCLV